jgi:hypothetical protein
MEENSRRLILKTIFSPTAAALLTELLEESKAFLAPISVGA